MDERKGASAGPASSGRHGVGPTCLESAGPTDAARDAEIAELRSRVAGLEAANAELHSRVAQVESEATASHAERETLRGSQRMLRMVMDTIPQRIFWKDPQYRILGCNRHFWQDGGYSSESEIVGKSDFELSWRKSAHIYRADDVAVVERGLSKVNYEEPLVRADGRRLWLRTTKVPLRDEDGRVIGLFGCYEDITERREALRALRESEARYRALFDSAQDGIFVSDGDGRFAGVNSAGQAMLGYSEEELCKKRILDVVDPLDLARNPFRPEVLQVGKSFMLRRNLRRKDGQLVAAEINGTALPDGTLVGVARDIGERLRAEEERRRLQEELLCAQKMESIGRLAGGVAHDFNNLLLVILANAHLVRRKVPDSRELDGIIAAGERASTLTRQLLSFSRRRILKPTVLDFNKILRGLQQVLEQLLGEAVKLKLVLCETPCLILADAGQIEQVVLNLAVNARDAIDDGGTVTISTELKPSAGDPTHAVVRVSDTGHGMDAETQRQIFDPFFTTKRLGEGAGLGLAMVYGIVRQSGGSISVSSAPGQGTTFGIRLPITYAEVEAPTHVPVAMRGVEPGETTILLVDDEQSVRNTIERALLDAGYRVLVASDGDEALRLGLAHIQEVDLLLTDVVMPTLSGPLVSERLLSERPNLRVILMSGYSDRLFDTDGVWDERASFMEKPFTPDDLLERVRQTLAEA